MPTSPASSATAQRHFVVLASVVMVLGLLYWAQAVLIPVALAILFTFLLSPVVTALQRQGLGRVVAVLIVVVFTSLILGGVTWLVARQFRGLVDAFPEYEQNLNQKIASFRSAGEGGFVEKVERIVKRVTREFKREEPSKAVSADEPAAQAPSEKPQLVKVVEDDGPFTMRAVWAAMAPLLEPFAVIGLAVVLVVFMLVSREDLRDRVIGLLGHGRMTVTTKALDDAGDRISRYLLMQLIINGSFGLAVAIGLFALRVDYPFLWGLLAAILRYVPYIGPWIAAIFPIGLSLLIAPGWAQPLAVVGMFVVFEFVSNMIMEPWLYGRGVGVSQTASMVMVAFWTWLWGPVGLVLATPLTVCLVVLGKYVPPLKFFDTLLGEQPALEASASYYQRLLARDAEEAGDVVEEYMRVHEPEAIYDNVLIPALLLAWRDGKQGRLMAEDETFVYQATRSILQDLPSQTRTERAPADERTRVEAGQELKAHALILGCPAHHEAEELIVEMFGQIMKRAGHDVDVVATKTVPPEVVSRIEQGGCGYVFVAVLPGGLPQARHLCRALKSQFADLPIVVGYWGRKEDFDKVLVQLRHVGAEHLTTSLLQTRGRLESLIESAATRRPAARETVAASTTSRIAPG